jgi:hypothetical protein
MHGNISPSWYPLPAWQRPKSDMLIYLGLRTQEKRAVEL